MSDYEAIKNYLAQKGHEGARLEIEADRISGQVFLARHGERVRQLAEPGMAQQKKEITMPTNTPKGSVLI